MHAANQLLAIHTILQKDVGRASGLVAEVWGIVLSKHLGIDSLTEEQTYSLLDLLRRNLTIVEMALKAKSCPDILFSEALTRMRNATMPVAANQRWDGIWGNLATPEIGLAIGWAAWTLSPEGGYDESQQIEELQGVYARLLDTLEQIEATESLKQMLREELANMLHTITLAQIGDTSEIVSKLKFLGWELFRRRSDVDASAQSNNVETRQWVGAFQSALASTVNFCQKQAEQGAFAAEAIKSLPQFKDVWPERRLPE